MQHNKLVIEDQNPLTTMRILLLAGVFLSLFTFAQSQEMPASNADRGVPAKVVGDEKPYYIIYDHALETISLLDADGSELDSWSNQNAFAPIAPLLDIPPDRPVQVEIRNANALLYGYNVTHLTARESNVRSCKELGRSFTGNILTSFIPSAQAALTNSVPEAFDTSALYTLLEGRSDLPSPSEGYVTEDRGDMALSVSQVAEILSQIQFEGTIDRYAAKVRQMQTIVDGIDETILSMAMRAEEEPIIPIVDEILAEIQTAVDNSTTDFEPASVAKAVVTAREPVKPVLGRLKSLQQDLYGAGSDYSDVTYTLASMIDEIELTDEALLSASEDLADYIYQLKKTRALATQYFALPASPNYRRVTISLVAENEIFEEMQSLPRYKEGTISFYSQAKESVDCQISLGVSIMNPLPEYALDNEGHLVDLSANSEDPRTTANLLFHFSSHRFPLLGIHGGLGLGEGTSRPDLYAGASIRFLNPVLINVGAVWRYRPSLPDGIKVGDLVTRADDIERIEEETLSNRYLPNVFIGIGFAIR